MKWVGALLIIITTTLLGLEWSNHLNERPKQIRQLKNALQVLEAEMLYSQLTLQEIFYNIANQLPHPTADFFQSLAKHMDAEIENFIEFWDEHVDSFIAISAVGKNEIDILKQFGRSLGQYDFTQQQKQIQLTMTHLDRELQNAENQQKRYEKMSKSLGFLGGLFIVLLFI